MKKKAKLLLLFFSIPIVVAIVLAFSMLLDGNTPPDRISETITITATVETQVHFTRTVSDGIGVSTGE